MPIYAQWKWEEKTKTFVLILHFDADWSKKNLRNKEMGFQKFSRIEIPGQIYIPFELVHEFSQSNPRVIREKEVRKRTVTTWSPTHVEIGLMSELLSYANILNGFKVWERESLIGKLIVTAGSLKFTQILVERAKQVGEKQATEELRNSAIDLKLNEPFDKFYMICGEKPFLVGAEYNYKNDTYETVFCFEVSQEYIDYLKEALKPFMK